MSRARDGAAIAAAQKPEKRGYLAESEAPLTSLLFLLPLIIFYEVGTRYFTTAAQRGVDQQIIAFTMMQRLFHLFGANAQHLPALAVVAILLAWHLAYNVSYQFHLSTLAGMAAESTLLALPLIALARELPRYFPLLATHGNSRDLVIMSVGAGIYEEVVFRLILFSLLSFALKDALRLHTIWVHLAVVGLSAVAFSAYHYLSPVEAFHWRSFVFRTLAGAYFGELFLLRGFGITAGCHAAYDILILFI